MSRAGWAVAHARKIYTRKEIITKSRRRQGRVIDVIIARLNGRAGANQELAQYIGAVNFRLIGMGMKRRGAGVVMVTRSSVWVVMQLIGNNTKIAASLKRPNRAGIKYRKAVQNEN